MSWKNPIDRQSKKHLLNDKRFFNLLSEQYNFGDKNTAVRFYMGLVHLIAKELRINGVAQLPHLGIFGLVRQQPRIGWMGKSHVFMGPKRVLRFYPKEKLRRYFSKRNQ